MKWWLYLLLLANVALFAWMRLQPTVSPAGGAVLQSPPGERLVLLSELPEEPEPLAGDKPSVEDESLVGEEIPPAEEAVADISLPEAEPGPTLICFRIGAIPSSAQADRLVGRLQEMGTEVLARGTEQTKQRSFWVMLPAFKTRVDANAVMKRLKAAGIRDHYLIPAGYSKNVLSLGVFSSREAAQRHQARIESLKLKTSQPPQIEEISLPAKRYWLTIAQEEDMENPPWQVAAKASNAISREVPCP